MKSTYFHGSRKNKNKNEKMNNVHLKTVNAGMQVFNATTIYRENNFIGIKKYT